MYSEQARRQLYFSKKCFILKSQLKSLNRNLNKSRCPQSYKSRNNPFLTGCRTSPRQHWKPCGWGKGLSEMYPGSHMPPSCIEEQCEQSTTRVWQIDPEMQPSERLPSLPCLPTASRTSSQCQMLNSIQSAPLQLTQIPSYSRRRGISRNCAEKTEQEATSSPPTFILKIFTPKIKVGAKRHNEIDRSCKTSGPCRLNRNNAVPSC